MEMSTNNLRPELRYVEAFPIEQEDKVFFLIRDPLESPGPLIMSPAEFFLVSHFDGQHTLTDIKLKFAERFDGVLLPEGHLEKLVQILDENYFLNTPAFYEHQKRTLAEYINAPVRPAWHAGTAYEDDPQALRKQLESFYLAPAGAGLPQLLSQKSNGSQVLCPSYLVPHIDLRVGGACYTHAFRHLAENYRPEVVIVLGVAHYGGEKFFNATRKDFETPLGTVGADQDFLNRWQARAPEALFEQEWVHRTEHSIEFQIPFLQHALDYPFTIVPVLCGSLELHLRKDSKLGRMGRIDELIDSLKETIREEEREVALLLSVDLAHMGPKFGDEEAIDDLKAASIREADHRFFEALSRWDEAVYWETMRSDLLPRKVDACAALYAFLRMFDAGQSRLLCYDQNRQPDTGSVVTFASMLLQPRSYRE